VLSRTADTIQFGRVKGATYKIIRDNTAFHNPGTMKGVLNVLTINKRTNLGRLYNNGFSERVVRRHTD
jgi:hypothetical protein